MAPVYNRDSEVLPRRASLRGRYVIPLLAVVLLLATTGVVFAITMLGKGTLRVKVVSAVVVEGYAVYNDAGIPSDADVWTWDGSDWDLEPGEFDGDYPMDSAPEGSQVFMTKSGPDYFVYDDNNNLLYIQPNYAGWGVFLAGTYAQSDHIVDLSKYNTLKFWVKTSQDLMVEVQQDDRNGPKSTRYISQHGWTGENTWQEITIPASAFADVDGSKIFCPFMVTVESGENTFYIDNVRWIGENALYFWKISVVDSAGSVGYFTSIALDSLDNPHISYRDATNGDLRYARWTGSAWEIQTVDSAGDVGDWTSIALDSSNYPHISYHDFSNHDLKYARWTGSAWEIQTIDSAGDVGWYTSIALDSLGNPHISYQDISNKDLRYARWTGSAWEIQTIDSAGDVGDWTSIALDSSNYPHISYHDWGNNDLKYARWTGSAWEIQTIDSAGDVGYFTSIALDSLDNPHISYSDATNRDLRYARWTGSAWEIQTVDTAENVGNFYGYTSIALDHYGYPHISYQNYIYSDLKYARWTGSAWEIQTVENASEVGKYTSIALDSLGNPHISYFDLRKYDLKYARWRSTW